MWITQTKKAEKLNLVQNRVAGEIDHRVVAQEHFHAVQHQVHHEVAVREALRVVVDEVQDRRGQRGGQRAVRTRHLRGAHTHGVEDIRRHGGGGQDAARVLHNQHCNKGREREIRNLNRVFRALIVIRPHLQEGGSGGHVQ